MSTNAFGPALRKEGERWKPLKHVFDGFYHAHKHILAQRLDKRIKSPRVYEPQLGNDGVCSTSANTAESNMIWIFLCRCRERDHETYSPAKTFQDEYGPRKRLPRSILFIADIQAKTAPANLALMIQWQVVFVGINRLLRLIPTIEIFVHTILEV